MPLRFKIPFAPDSGAHFLGRNGAFEQHGLYIGHDLDEPLTLQPVRRNGMFGRCAVELPISNIPEVIGALQAILHEYKTSRPPLKMEVGKNYRCENGLIVYIHEKDLADHRYPYKATARMFHFSYDDTGKCETSNNIVEEVPVPVFEIGKTYRDRNNEKYLLTELEDGLLCGTSQSTGLAATWDATTGWLLHSQPSMSDLVEQART